MMMVAAEGSEDEGGGTSHAFEVSHPTVPHYYGDIVRRIFLVAAAVLLVASPFLASGSAVALPLAMIAALILAGLGALTNPRKMWVMIADSVAAIFGIVVSEIFAIAAWNAGSILSFVVAEALAISFLFALYYSVKTVRAMMLDQIGKKPTVGEFFT